MTVDQASTFLAGSLLTMIGIVIVVAGIVVINNIIHKFWKPVRVFTPDSWKAFNPPQQIEPHYDIQKEASQKV